MQRVPAGMEKPSDADKTVRRQTPVGAVDDHGGEGELPGPEASVQVRSTRPRNEGGVEVPSARLSQQGRERDVHEGNDGYLLETTGHPVGRIATQVGFGSQTTFRERFKRIVGTSPQAYRRAFRGSPVR
jgi:hypothetical protein